jgi:hypothetical protein
LCLYGVIQEAAAAGHVMASVTCCPVTPALLWRTTFEVCVPGGPTGVYVPACGMLLLLMVVVVMVMMVVLLADG